MQALGFLGILGASEFELKQCRPCLRHVAQTPNFLRLEQCDFTCGHVSILESPSFVGLFAITHSLAALPRCPQMEQAWWCLSSALRSYNRIQQVFPPSDEISSTSWGSGIRRNILYAYTPCSGNTVGALPAPVLLEKKCLCEPTE